MPGEVIIVPIPALIQAVAVLSLRWLLGSEPGPAEFILRELMVQNLVRCLAKMGAGRVERAQSSVVGQSWIGIPPLLLLLCDLEEVT